MKHLKSNQIFVNNISDNELNTRKESILEKIEILFDDTYILLVLGTDFTSALWYNKLKNKFNRLLEKEFSMDYLDFVNQSLNIYKELFIKKET